MVIKKVIHKENSPANQINNSNRYNNRIGFWGDVIEVDSSKNKCTVRNDQGLLFKSIQISSKEWVSEKKNYVSSERYLPPVNSRVFVLVPDGNIGSAFVLCSGFPYGEKGTHDLWAKDETDINEIEEKNNKYERVSQGGWTETESYLNGNKTYTSLNKNIELKIICSKDGNEEECIELQAWNSNIVINADGINFNDKNKNTIVATKNKIEIKDGNDNSILFDQTGIHINGDNFEVLL